MRTDGHDVRFWDRAARKYAAAPIKDLAGYERTLARTIELVGRPDTVLELGCGTGTTALRLAPHVTRIAGTDISPAMIAIARDKAAAQSVTNVDFAVGTPDNATVPDDSFDHVLAFNLLHLIIERTGALASIHRLLKPGGLFITKTVCLSEMNPLIRLAIPLMQLLGKAPQVAVFRGDELAREIEAAGFRLIEQGRHGTGRKDPRIFIVAQKPRE